MSGNDLKSRKKKGKKKPDRINDIPKGFPKAVSGRGKELPEEVIEEATAVNTIAAESVPETTMPSLSSDTAREISKAAQAIVPAVPAPEINEAVAKEIAKGALKTVATGGPEAAPEKNDAAVKEISKAGDANDTTEAMISVDNEPVKQAPKETIPVKDVRGVSRARPGKKGNKKKKIGKPAVKNKGRKKVIKATVETKAPEAEVILQPEPPLNFNSLQQRIDNIRQVIGPDAVETPLNFVTNQNLNQNPVIASDRFFHNPQKTNYFIIISILSIIIFLAAGYVYPATEDDMINGKVIWSNSAKSGGGLFSELYASIAFTVGVFMMGYYVNTTFIRFNVMKWNYF